MNTAVLSLGLPPDGVGLVLFRAGRTPFAATLDRAAVAALAGELPRLLAAPEGVLVPGEDAGLAASEREVALRLAGLLDSGAVGAGLALMAHQAAEGGRRLSLLLDLRDDLLRRLPWELLEGLAPADAGLAPCRVARLVDAPGPSPEPTRPGGVGVELRVLDQADPLCADLAASTLAALDGLAGLRSNLGTGAVAPAPGEPSGLRVLHLISHGRVAHEQVHVALGRDRQLDPAAATQWVDPVSAGLDLVILDVCSGGAWEGAPGSAPAERLVQGGLAAAIAPSVPVDPEASLCFSVALYGALGAGRPLAEAVDVGRRALAGLGVAHPSCRSWAPILVVRDAGALQLRSTSAALSSWAPTAGPELLEVLGRARDLAAVHGFLGVEHLALVLSRWERPVARLALARTALQEIGDRLKVWQPGAADAVGLTPRLRALLGGLPVGAGIDALMDGLAEVPWVAAALPAAAGGPRSLETLVGDLEPSARAGGDRGLPVSGVELELLGGPEDGRRLRWTLQAPLLGRWDPQRDGAAAELYRGGGAYDPAASRRHLRLESDGRVRVLAEAWVERGRTTAPLLDLTPLRVGEVLVIGAATRLLVRAVDAGPSAG